MHAPGRRSFYLWITVAAFGAIFFGIGWLARGTDQPAISHPLRLNGYRFIDPLLACNVSNPNAFQKDQSLSNDFTSIINAGIRSGEISKASVYFTDLKSGQWANVNPSDTYYPSSLGKIPIMMAYYELAENSSTLLDKKITYTGGSNLNAQQDITPPKAIVQGQTYTVEQLIEYMVKYSDNNATQLLYDNIDQDVLQNVYGDLGIPINDDPTLVNLDFITTQQIELLFKILYNGTYLSRDYSEKALELMSQSSFTQGLAAGIPNATVASHKLGLVSIAPNGVTTEHELHDCGIVYAQNPYLMCVMTRGASPLTTMESIIASLSQSAYQHVENGD